jgi:ribonuclease BN (tRNA processing enzyme)
LEADRFLGPARPGKKCTILGDCYEVSEAMIKLAQDSDVIVHEATLENAFEAKAVGNGHSTPSTFGIYSNTLFTKTPNIRISRQG